MVPDQHARSRLQMLFAFHGLEPHACGKKHGIFECTPSGPLADSMLAEQAEKERGEHAVGGAEEEGAVGGEEPGVEGGFLEGEEVGEGEEGESCAEVEGEDAEEDEQRGEHCVFSFWLCCVLLCWLRFGGRPSARVSGRVLDFLGGCRNGGEGESWTYF